MVKVLREEITVEATINEPIKKVWEYWTKTQHITHWNNASEDWHTPLAENELKIGGRFLYRMEAKDGSYGFDFSGTYDEVRLYEFISYILEDDRKVRITFINQGYKTHIIEKFEAEEINTIELQHFGWQVILDNFKKYTERE